MACMRATAGYRVNRYRTSNVGFGSSSWVEPEISITVAIPFDATRGDFALPQLVVLPSPLVFDYGWAPQSNKAALQRQAASFCCS